MLISNEYIKLKNQETGELLKIKPYTPFELPEGMHTNIDSANILDNDTREFLYALTPGQKDIGTVREPIKVKRKKVVEDGED